MQDQALTLIDLKPHQIARIRHILGESDSTLRFQELGCTPGTDITVLAKLAFGGPLLVHVRGAKLAIRKEDAKAVLVDLT